MSRVLRKVQLPAHFEQEVSPEPLLKSEFDLEPDEAELEAESEAGPDKEIS